MKILILTAIILAGITASIIFSPFRSGPASHDNGSLLIPSRKTERLPFQGEPSGPSSPSSWRLASPLELQVNINATLRSYGMQTIEEDGKLGPRTATAYLEAYSLQQAAELERGCYE